MFYKAPERRRLWGLWWASIMALVGFVIVLFIPKIPNPSAVALGYWLPRIAALGMLGVWGTIYYSIKLWKTRKPPKGAMRSTWPLQ
jgi:hypothetical protein